jgi:hypothetical protein
MGLPAAERKSKSGNYVLGPVGTQAIGRYMLHCAVAEICGYRKGFVVRTRAGSPSKGVRARAFAPAGLTCLTMLALAGCNTVPKIAGVSDAPEPMSTPVYRNLADIPEPPTITAPEMNQGTIQTLTDDRAKTAQAAEDLRRQPFNQPDPATQPGF